MKAVVVYELLWGNTAAVARAVAEGLGPEVSALTTDEATASVVAEADLVVAGAPVMAFRLGTNEIRAKEALDPGKVTVKPDLSHGSMRDWLAALPHGRGRSAAFETAFRWSPGGATGAILNGVEQAGYRPLAKGRRFIVTGVEGPLRDGELDRARAWGADLARRVQEEEPEVALAR